MTALAVLATGNHYVLDVLAGLATLAQQRCSSRQPFSAKSAHPAWRMSQTCYEV